MFFSQFLIDIEYNTLISSEISARANITTKINSNGTAAVYKKKNFYFYSKHKLESFVFLSSEKCLCTEQSNLSEKHVFTFRIKYKTLFENHNRLLFKSVIEHHNLYTLADTFISWNTNALLILNTWRSAKIIIIKQKKSLSKTSVLIVNKND